MDHSQNVGQPIHVNILTDVYIDSELNNREIGDTPDETQELMLQIETCNGLLQPIGIYPTPDERKTEHPFPYELGFGYRRCAALKQLATDNEDPGWVTNVPAMLKEQASPAQRHLEQLIENLARKQLEPMETALALKKAIDDPAAGLSQTELAKKLGMKPSTLSNYLKAANELDPAVQGLVMDKKLTWSAAKEIAALGLSADQQKTAAEIGCSLTYDDFVKHLNETYKADDEASDEAPATGTAAETTAPTPTQKTHTSVRAQTIKDKYIPHLEEALSKSQKESEKEKLAIRLDTLKFVLNVAGTELAAELSPWEQELQEKEAEGKLKTEQDRHEKAYVRKAITAINTILKQVPPATLEDGTANPNRKMATLPEALQKVREDVESQLAKAKADGVWVDGETPEMPQGFPVETVDSFMEKIATEFTAHEKKVAENAKVAHQKKLEKEAKEKAEAEAAAAAGTTPAGAGVDAATAGSEASAPVASA